MKKVIILTLGIILAGLLILMRTTGKRIVTKETLEFKYSSMYNLQPDIRTDYRKIWESVCSAVSNRLSEYFGHDFRFSPAWLEHSLSPNLCVVMIVRENAWSGVLNSAFLVEDENLIIVNIDKLEKSGFDIRNNLKALEIVLQHEAFHFIDRYLGVSLPYPHSVNNIVYKDHFIGIEFKQTYGDYEFETLRTYESKELGYGLNYRSKGGALTTIIIYDLGIQGIQNGKNGYLITQQYKQTIDDMYQQNYVVKENKVTWDPAIVKSFICGSYIIKIKYEMNNNSNSNNIRIRHILLTGRNGKFIKILCSYHMKKSKELEDFQKLVRMLIEQFQ